MSQDPPKIPKESPFLHPKETKIPPSDDPTSPREMKRARTNQESPQDSSFLSSKETENHIMSQGLYETSNCSVSPMNIGEEAFKRSLDSAGNMGSQKYLESIEMMPTSGYVNSSENDKNNSGQSYLGVEAFNNSVDVRTGRHQQISDSSIIGVHSGTWFANSDEDFQQAYDNLQRLGMPGEGYGTNIADLFGSGGNIASMSSQRDSLKPEMQQKMSNVSNSSMGGGVGMNAKSVDSGPSSTATTRNPQHAYDNYQHSGLQGERYGTNSSDSLGYRSNISLNPVGMLKTQKDKEKNHMISTPKSVDAPTWTITKKLTKADVNQQLNLSKWSTEKHIRTHLSVADSQNIGKGEPVTVTVYDYDMGTMHELDLVHWPNNIVTVLTRGWLEDFVQRRGLNKGDEIGLVWDESAYMLQFGVISRANAKAPAEKKKQVIP